MNGIPRAQLYACLLYTSFGITVQNSEEDDLALLTSGDAISENTTNSQIAAGIRLADNPTLVAQTVKSVLDTTDELEKEKKKKSFVFDQVMKAATLLTNAVSNLDDAMSKDCLLYTSRCV